MFDELVAEEQTHLLLLEAQYEAIEKSGTFVAIDECWQPAKWDTF